jgi:hypothetical protein
VKNKNDFYIAFYERLALHGFQAYAAYDKGRHIADICIDGCNIAHLTQADTIEPNPYAEDTDPAVMKAIGEIAKTAALRCGICTKKPYDESKHEQLPDGAYKLAEVDGTVLSCAHNPLLGYVFSVRDRADERQQFYSAISAGSRFAVKSGLVDEGRIFTDEEMTVIHNSLVKMRIALDESLSFDETAALDAVTSKIESIMPELGGYDVYAGLKSELCRDMSEGALEPLSTGDCLPGSDKEDGRESQWERADFLGIVKPESLQKWLEDMPVKNEAARTHAQETEADRDSGPEPEQADEYGCEP